MARIVLVHGFWADGSSWNDVIPHLDAAGHEVLAVQLPLTSFADDVATTRRALARSTTDTVLVGHSYAGSVISEAAVGAPNVAALVYVAAYGLDQGEDLNALNEQYPPASHGAAIRPSDDGYLWLDVDLFTDAFAQDVDPSRARVMALTQGPASLACLSGLTAKPAWTTLPTWFVISTEDRTISPEAQRFFAQRMGATITEIPASHAAMVSRPADVAAPILHAASLPAAS